MTFRIRKPEIVALRKLALVSKALALQLKGTDRVKQSHLAQTLVDVLDRYEIETAKAEPGK